MNILVVDVGGTHVKVLATDQTQHREFVSGPTLTAAEMVDGVKKRLLHLYANPFHDNVERTLPSANPATFEVFSQTLTGRGYDERAGRFG